MADLTPAVIEPQSPLESLIEMTLATCISPHTRRAYRTQLVKFITSKRPLTREGVALYLQEERDGGCNASSLLGALSAIRKLANEAQLRNLITFETNHNIQTIKGPQRSKVRSGNWLTITQVEKFLSLPDRTTYWGKRDACILSLMIGCGLRRAEMASLPWSKYQSRDGRMCLVDFIGKGDKPRTLPVPLWAQADCDLWYEASRGPEPVPVTKEEKMRLAWLHKDHSLITGGLTYEGLADLVELYGERLGVPLAPHDLRRSLAQMLRRSGAALEQIQYTLGHQDIKTTVIYLGSQLELAPGKAAVDVLQLSHNLVKRTPGTAAPIPPEKEDILYAKVGADRRAIQALQAKAKEDSDAR